MAYSVDSHVGQRLRHRRWMEGMTQQQLGDEIGIPLEQIQKFEAGKKHISARRMSGIAAAMNVPMAYFFEGIEGEEPETDEARGVTVHDEEAVELIRNYYTIPEKQRRRLVQMARVLSEAA